MWCQAAAAENEAPDGKPPLPAEPAFVKLAPINIPVIKGNQVTQQVDILLELELAQGKTKGDVEPKLPELQDAFLTDLYVIFQQRPDASQPIDGALLKERLHRTADRILDPGLVKDVLIMRLFQQPHR